MVNFPHLQELAAAADSYSMFDSIAVYYQRENDKGIHLANGLQKSFVDLVHVIKDTQEFITELEGYRPSAMTYKVIQDLQKVQRKNVLKVLEIKKLIVETHAKVLDKNNFLDVLRTQ